MAKEVILTPIAVADFENVMDYLTHNWGIKVTNNFIRRFDKVIGFLTESPGMFPFFDKRKRIQRCVVTKHNILYFIDSADSVKIITVFDTRQNPEKLEKFI